MLIHIFADTYICSYIGMGGSEWTMRLSMSTDLVCEGSPWSRYLLLYYFHQIIVIYMMYMVIVFCIIFTKPSYMVFAGEECFEEHLTKRRYHYCSKSGGWVELSRTSCTNETEDEWIEHNDKKKTQLLTQEAKRAEAWGRSRWPGEREDCRWWYSVVLWNIWISFILGDNTHNYCAFRGVFRI